MYMYLSSSILQVPWSFSRSLISSWVAPSITDDVCSAPCHVQAVQRGEITTVLRTDVDVVDYYTNRKLEKMIKKIKRQFNIYIFWNRFWKKPCHASLVHTNITLLPNPWIVTYESLGVFVKITLVKKRYEFSGNNFILGSWYQLHLSL